MISILSLCMIYTEETYFLYILGVILCNTFNKVLLYCSLSNVDFSVLTSMNCIFEAALKK